jgi:hypothetical protein
MAKGLTFGIVAAGIIRDYGLGTLNEDARVSRLNR